eukprot:jgi/Orpsp1_1/1179526/evm.model.c7180000069712.1
MNNNNMNNNNMNNNNMNNNNSNTNNISRTNSISTVKRRNSRLSLNTKTTAASDADRRRSIYSCISSRKPSISTNLGSSIKRNSISEM